MPTINASTDINARVTGSSFELRHDVSSQRDRGNYAWMRVCPSCHQKLCKHDPEAAWSCRCGWQTP